MTTMGSSLPVRHPCRLVLVGHPRCGSKYAAALCAQLGLDIGHERMGKDGISSWMFAVDAESYPFALDAVSRSRRGVAWEWSILHLRSLATSVPSVMRESIYSPESYLFRRKHIRRRLEIDLGRFPGEFERAIWSITSWSRLILEERPDFWFRIEDGEERLREFLIQAKLIEMERREVILDLGPVNADLAYYGAHYPSPRIGPEDWSRVSGETRDEILWYCRTFGYPPPSGL